MQFKMIFKRKYLRGVGKAILAIGLLEGILFSPLSAQEAQTKTTVTQSTTDAEFKTLAGKQLIEYLSIHEMSIQDVVSLITQGTSINVTASDETKAKKILVSIELKNVSCFTAIEQICKIHNLRIDFSASSNVVTIVTMDELQNKVTYYGDEVAEVIPVLYPPAETIGETLQRIYPERVRWNPPKDTSGQPLSSISKAYDRLDKLGKRARTTNDSTVTTAADSSSDSDDTKKDVTEKQETALESTTGFMRRSTTTSGERLTRDTFEKKDEGKYNAATAANLRQENSNEHVQPGGVYISSFPHTNTLLVRSEDPKSIEHIKAIIAQLDKPEPQILLEVKVLDLILDDEDRRGIDWLFQAQNSTGKQYVDGGASRGMVDTDPGNPGSALNLGQTISTPNSSLVPQGEGIDRRAIILNYIGDDLRARLQMLQTENRLVRLATPNLLVADNEASEVFVGTDTTVLEKAQPTTTTTTTSGVSESSTSWEITAPRKKIGTYLTIVPRIHADRTVTIRILQESSSLDGDPVSIQYGSATEYLKFQKVAARSVNTTIIAKDSSLIAIGGLVSEEVRDYEMKTPFLSDIPWIGNLLFTHTRKLKSQHELMVLVRPFILLAPGEGEKISIDFLSRISKHPSATADLPELGIVERDEIPVGPVREKMEQELKTLKKNISIKSMEPQE